jgi:hypothetical protein
LRAGNSFDRDQTARFCAALRPGDPPDGQRLLREAFTAYSEASVRKGKEKAELMLLANVAAGYHEQIRLQPEIAEALNASVAGAMDFKRSQFTRLVAHFRLREDVLSHGLFDLDALFGIFLEEVNHLIREVITDRLMTLHLSRTATLRLGRDLSGEFPQSLMQLQNPCLRAFLAQVDLTPDSLNATGATDWANFKERMHFIADFFRAYQERQYLFEAPFTASQGQQLKTGQRPDGPL